MQEGNDDINRVIYIPFTTMSDLKDTHYLDSIWFTYQTPEYEQLEQAVRTILAAGTSLTRVINRRCSVFNLMTQVHQFEIITMGLKILMGFIGTLTLGIGGVGLMNIMLVSVTQRTREIGVQKALGAPRRYILMQFLAEALAITFIGGVLGSHSGLRRGVVGGKVDAVQRLRQKWRGRRHPPDDRAGNVNCGHTNPGNGRISQWHDPCLSRIAPGSDRSFCGTNSACVRFASTCPKAASKKGPSYRSLPFSALLP